MKNSCLTVGNKPNTIANAFKNLRAVLKKAVKLGLIQSNGRIWNNNRKQPLTIDEITKIIEFDIPKRFKGMERAKDMFLFSFYTAGMRVTGLCKLQWSNIVDENIIYTMNKSKKRSGSKRNIPLNKKFIWINLS